MVWEQFLPSEILTMQAYENAIMVDMAIGGSTNAIIHLTALAGRSKFRSTWKVLIEFPQGSRCFSI